MGLASDQCVNKEPLSELVDSPDGVFFPTGHDGRQELTDRGVDLVFAERLEDFIAEARKLAQA